MLDAIEGEGSGGAVVLKDGDPTVSVIIPTYNRGNVIGRTIASAIRQTYRSIGIIVVDDGSTDNTLDVVKGFDDARLRYVRHERNLGGPWARNSGARAARGEYLAFLDSDDVWYPEMVETQIGELSEAGEEVGMVCCAMVRCEGGQRSVIKPKARDLTVDGLLLSGDGICTSSFLVRREAFYALGGFDTDFESFQDFEFLLRMSAKYGIIAIDEILLQYHVGSDGISADMLGKAAGLNRIISAYRDEIVRLGLMHRYLFRVGQYQVLAGDLQGGRELWQVALRWHPRFPKLWFHFVLSLAGTRVYKKALRARRRLSRLRLTSRIPVPGSLKSAVGPGRKGGLCG